ncbi:MAG: RNA polymerase sigma factor [Solirubrobacteraceae bacterium]
MSLVSGRDRSKEAFERLYERVAERLLAFIVRRLGDPDAAAELWAECWAVAFERWHGCRASASGEEEAWVFGIARKRLAGYYRSGAIERRALVRLGWSLPELDRADLDALERLAELDGLKRVIADALAELPTNRQRALRLRIIDGLSYREVAARMGCTEQAARATSRAACALWQR